jgi:uncharacterized protein YecE (DUF72 family)
LNCWIGTSGWVYPHWAGVFYPDDLAQKEWLSYYTKHFCTVELNSSFYRLPSEEAFMAWANATPPGFRFAVKASRYLTHMKKLREPAEPLARFLPHARLLGDKLGPILYQLPPRWKCNLPRLQDFLSCLPADLRHVFEFRDPSWISEDVFLALRDHNVGFCIISHPNISCPIVTTSDLAYIRMHGAETLYGSNYSEQELQWWAGQILEILRAGHTVYVYFNNDAYGYAVANARRLIELRQPQDTPQRYEEE